MFDLALFTICPAARPGVWATASVQAAGHSAVASNQLQNHRQMFAPPGAAQG